MGVLENQGGIAGEIAARLVGTAWALVTFLAVPVIAIEGTGPFGTLKRSASIFKGKWGQQITGNIAIGAAVFLLGFLPAAILIAAGIAVWASASFVGALLVVIGALVLAVAILVSKALNGDLRRRPLPLRDRGRSGRRLHPGGAGVGGQGQGRPPRAARRYARNDLSLGLGAGGRVDLQPW